MKDSNKLYFPHVFRIFSYEVIKYDLYNEKLLFLKHILTFAAASIKSALLPGSSPGNEAVLSV